jgi:helicase
MNPPQQEILDSGLLIGPFGCVLNMPTGSGKTWLSQRAIQETIEKGGRAIYLTPLRALANEIAQRWANSMSNFPVGVFTGDFGNGKAFPVPFDKARVLVMTPERLDACTRSWRSHWNWIPEVNLLVVDEIHLVGEPNRGPRLEGALSRFRRLNPFCRVIGLSATLGNAEELANWLDGITYQSKWRPIELEWRIAHFRKPAEKTVVLEGEVARNLKSGGKSLVFVQSRRRAEELSRHLEANGIRARHHHAGLDHETRRDAECSLQNGNVDVVVATGTLEMGLNLPVRQVVLYDLQTFDGRDFVPLSTNSVWQRAGRAGRPGLDDRGEAVLVCPKWDKSAEGYQRGRFEPIRSRLDCPAAMAEQIMAEVASGISNTRIQLQRAFKQTLGGMQGTVADLDRNINLMCDAALLEERMDAERTKTGYVLKATKAGRVAVRHMLSPLTVVTVRRVLARHSELSYLDLLTLMTSTIDCEPVLSVDFEELDSLAAAIASEPSFLLQISTSELEKVLEVSSRRLLSSMKMAYALRVWTRLGDFNQSAELTDCYPFEIRRLAESTSRLLQATSELLSAEKLESDDEPKACAPDEPNMLERIRALQKMIEYGLDESSVTLCFVSGIGGTFARRLSQEGIRDIEELVSAEPEELSSVRGLSQTRARKWIEEATSKIKTFHGFRVRDFGPRTLSKAADWAHDIDPYRLRRSLDLSVECLGIHEYRVTGGLEPHQVTAEGTTFHCDCVDFERGNQCKHILAVKANRRDPSVIRTAKLLSNNSVLEGLDLYRLWLSREPNARISKWR